MLLAVDIGNSNTKLAIFDKQVLVDTWHYPTEVTRTADLHAAWLSTPLIKAGVKIDAIKKIIVGSVVPEATPPLIEAITRLFGFQPKIIENWTETFPIKALVEPPSEAGADRLIAAFAAGKLYEKPALVIDLGTATTFSIINKDGNYCGGAIVPGVRVSLRALYRAAAKLPQITLEKPNKVSASNTVDAMQAGSFYGTVSMIEGMIKRLETENGGFKTIVVTGGLSPLFDGSIEGVTVFNPTLTLTGLNLLDGNDD